MSVNVEAKPCCCWPGRRPPAHELILEGKEKKERGERESERERERERKREREREQERERVSE